MSASSLDDAFETIDLIQQSRRITVEQVVPLAIREGDALTATWKLLQAGYLCGIEVPYGRASVLDPAPEVKCLRHRVPGFPQCKTFYVGFKLAEGATTKTVKELAAGLREVRVHAFHPFCLGDEDGLLDPSQRQSAAEVINRIKPGDDAFQAVQDVFGTGAYCGRLASSQVTSNQTFFCGSQYDFRSHLPASGVEIQLGRAEGQGWSVLHARELSRVAEF